MRADIMQRLGLGALDRVRNNPSFPYKTGNLKFNATYLSFVGENEFRIIFDRTIAPYIDFLEEGVKPQFYVRETRGGTRTIFTNGSTRHVGFISERAVNDVIQYLAEQFRSPVMYQVENNGKSVFKSAGGNEDD